MNLDSNLVYLSGVIAGDGYIRNGVKSKFKHQSRDYKIVIDSGDKEFLEYILTLIKSYVKTKTTIKIGNNSYRITITNKKLFQLMTNDLEIPTGKKSDIIRFPSIIKNNDNYTKSFIAGMFDTDGGFRKNSIGFCTSSKEMIKELHSYLILLNIDNTI